MLLKIQIALQDFKEKGKDSGIAEMFVGQKTLIDLGPLGVLTDEQIRIWIFILHYGNTVSSGKLNTTWDSK